MKIDDHHQEKQKVCYTAKHRNHISITVSKNVERFLHIGGLALIS